MLHLELNAIHRAKERYEMLHLVNQDDFCAHFRYLGVTMVLGVH